MGRAEPGVERFRPLEGYCLCLAPTFETSEGGIVVPAADAHGREENTPVRLTVVAVGPGEQMDAGRRREVAIEPGETYYFMFPQYSLGGVLTFGGVKYVVVQSKFVCGKAL